MTSPRVINTGVINHGGTIVGDVSVTHHGTAPQTDRTKPVHTSPPLFISHSHRDAHLASLVIQWLYRAVHGWPAEWVRCTSTPSQGLALGQPVVAGITADIEGAACVLALATTAGRDSTYVTTEWGAARALGRPLLPLSTPALVPHLGPLQEVHIGDGTQPDVWKSLATQLPRHIAGVRAAPHPPPPTEVCHAFAAACATAH